MSFTIYNYTITTIYGPLTACRFLAKANEPIPRKHLDRRTEGRTDRPYFTEPFRPRLGIRLAVESLELYIYELYG